MIPAEIRTRMEGGVEQLEALLSAAERLDHALRDNERLTQALELWRANDAKAIDARQRAAKFPDLAELLTAISAAAKSIDDRTSTTLKELRLQPPSSLDERLTMLAPQLPIVFRGTLESSGLVWGGVVLASLFGAASVMTTWPWLAAGPIAAGVGGLLWDRARSRAMIVSQQLLIIGARSTRLAAIEYIVVPRSMGAYRCKLEIHNEPFIELPAITPLLDVLREAGVEVRYE
ncbi:MAG: hypothetical protein QM723_21305 [Myxococcaceae bacterium]